MTAAAFRRLEAQWQRAADRWLPVATEGSIWRFGSARRDGLPSQGWKLHVSATVLSACGVLEAVGPALEAAAVPFKGPESLVALKRLNCGLFHGYTQVGKFLTVYPHDDAEASRLARELDLLTRGLLAPPVPFETPVAPDSNVYTRYGSFGGSPEQGGDDGVLDPDGRIVADRRDANPDWAVPPPGLVRTGRQRVAPATPLSSRFPAYEALSQRGKGGVYRALDLGTIPARLCVLKEGRASGEVDWDGSNGLSRVRREREVLDDLVDVPVGVPRVYGYFERAGNGYLALEWIEGTSLARLLRPDAERLAVADAVSIALDCAQALALVHEHGWVWRDLKPQNIIVSDGRLRLLDFEGAARVGEAVSSPWGTAGYLPPEWMDTWTAAPPQDCYALGVVIHQLFSGSSVQPGEDLSPLREARPEVPVLAERCVATLLDPDPRRRPDAGRVAEELGSLVVEPVG